MNRRTIVLLGAFGLFAAAQPVQAQMTAAPSKPSPTAKKPVRTASIPPSPPAQPVVVNTTGLTNNFVPPAQPGVAQPGVTRVTYYPTLVLANGTVVANFGTGRGYEEVLRQCPQLSGPLPPNATIAPCWEKDAYGNYRVMQRR